MMGRGRARATKDTLSFVARCSVFKDHLGGSTGLVASTLCSDHKKGPSFEGPAQSGRDAADLGSSLRGGSLGDAKQERPGSIALERSLVEESQRPTSRRNRRFPTCRIFPVSSLAGRSSRPPSRTSPSSLTAPWLSSRRASLGLIWKAVEINSGRWTSPSPSER